MLEKLRDSLPVTVYEWLDFTCVKYNITSRIQLAHFISQLAHESLSFNHKEENLNYSRAGLLKTFPKYFTPANVSGYVGNRQAIANRVYANRMGNGDESTGDGWMFRGRGFLQITGRYNYKKLSKAFGIDFEKEPDLLLSEKYACLSAGWFFSPIINKLDKLSVKEVTRFVNGGYNGLEDRQKKFEYYLKLVSL